MGRAITIASVLVLCSFAFVFYQLWIRRPASASPVRGPAQMLETREDGSVYAVSTEIDRFEKRLIEEEKRWVKLEAELQAMRKEREELRKTIEDLQGDVRRLRRQVAERHAPPSQLPTPAPVNPPVTPVTPEAEGTEPAPAPGR